MHGAIPVPSKGQRPSAAWAAAVTDACNAMNVAGLEGSLARDGAGAFGSAPLPVNNRDRRASAKPLPFEVRWDATLNDGEGGYKIYLPTEHLLSYGGTYINTSDISGATPIPDANGDDTAWSVLDDIDTSADHVWLVVTVAESSGSIVSVDAEFAAEEGQEATGENVVNICIAEVSYEEPENEGGTPTVEIKQSVVGALHLGSEADDPVATDDISTELCPHNAEPGADNTHEGELQIRGWNTGTPASTSTLTENIFSAGTNQYGIVARRSDAGHVGELVYLQPGSLNIDSNPLVVMSVDYVTKASDGGDFSAHPYAIRIKRGHLSYDAQNNILTVVEDVASKTFIDTRPLTQELS